MAVQVNYNEMEWSSLDPDPSRSNDDSSHLREYARVLIAYDNHVDIYVNALLTGCEKCHRTDDRIAYCEYCPEHCDCLWISNIICRMQMIRVNVFYFSSHDCFNTDGWWCCWCGSCVLLFLSSNLNASWCLIDLRRHLDPNAFEQKRNETEKTRSNERFTHTLRHRWRSIHMQISFVLNYYYFLYYLSISFKLNERFFSLTHTIHCSISLFHCTYSSLWWLWSSL